MKFRTLLASVMTGLAVAVTAGQAPASAAPAWVETIASGTRAVDGGVCASLDFVAFGCFERDGDVLTLVDEAADGHSAAIVWQNFVDGALYRRGACVEKRGKDVQGGCNMNFKEGSEIQIKACSYEAGASGNVADKIVTCGLSSRAFKA
ncbi:hypothetical protein [Actinoplanes sp. NBRC 101535]|uniref:hypothetical protein n=1 Tax=Actinoplanes sp. NBRC 101535 TaxID=3032196 RepID=UPI0024A0DAD9|nr:hypothetical protein [Actinoplanes sp. NBRC 101535]GLY07984.1 hypothetical protein Acsp01_83630 [Actinoplanes sp. NBRC 101535]